MDIFDRNPHPYGLVRTGVAPDHPEMKKIEKDYEEVLRDERCNFFGNVWVGANGGIAIEKLKQKYSGIVLAYGAVHERSLNLPHEKTLKNIFSSREIVNWYNGSLDSPSDFEENHLNLGDQVKDMAIIGNGNVAVDICRVFLKDPSKDFQKTDMPSSVIQALKRSSLRSI